MHFDRFPLPACAAGLLLALVAAQPSCAESTGAAVSAAGPSLPSARATDPPAPLTPEESAPLRAQPVDAGQVPRPATRRSVYDRQTHVAAWQSEVATPTAADDIQPAPDQRRLVAPPSDRARSTAPRGGQDEHRRVRSLLPSLPQSSLIATGAAMAIVLGLFVISIWLVRRSAPQAAQPLPDDVVAVLGRTQLAGRQFAHLLRVGNKLLLVSVTPEATETLTEISDPAEVDRLLGLCVAESDDSTTAAFQQVLERLAGERAEPGFLGREESFMPPGLAGDAYRSAEGNRLG